MMVHLVKLFVEEQIMYNMIEDGKVYKAFLYHIREKKEKEKQDVKQDKDIKDREGTRTEFKYYDKR